MFVVVEVSGVPGSLSDHMTKKHHPHTFFGGVEEGDSIDLIQDWCICGQNYAVLNKPYPNGPRGPKLLLGSLEHVPLQFKVPL